MVDKSSEGWSHMSSHARIRDNSANRPTDRPKFTVDIAWLYRTNTMDAVVEIAVLNSMAFSTQLFGSNG